jgi:predicted MFS family arabinose efflux permease
MTSTLAPGAPSTGLARAAIFAAFFGNGFLSTTWVVHIPRIKVLLGFDDGQLGLCLWAAALGLFAGMTLGGWIVERYRSQFVTGAATALLAIATILAVVSTHWLWLVLSLIPFGFFSGLMDVSMNSQAAAFEKWTGRAVMSSFHGFFSLGGLAGTLFGAGLLAARVSPLAHVLIAAVPCIFAGCVLHRALIPERNHSHGGGFFISVPSWDLLPLAAMAFVFFLAEGAVFDWSGVFLQTSLNVDVAAAGIGYGAFSLLMAAVRFCGDFWVARLGRNVVFVLGGLVGAGGLVLACLAKSYFLSVVGFGLVGVGLANCIPLIFSAAARKSKFGFGRAIASVASAGYLGLFTGPPLIGSIAQLMSLQNALLLVAGSVLAVLLLARVGLEGFTTEAQRHQGRNESLGD